jgi:cytidine deaminase
MQQTDQLVDSWRSTLVKFDWCKLKPLTLQHTLDLFKAAVRTRKRAYAPYSNFFVGAAILCRDGRIFSGCNVENASYGATVCAERIAAFSAISHGCRELLALAVIGEANLPLSPCGICRQVLAEFNPNLPVFMANMTGDLALGNLAKLLPLAFDLDPRPSTPKIAN